MPVDFSRNLIFVHIPKTGGTTVSELLGLNTPAQFVSNVRIPSISSERCPQHLTIEQLRAILSADFFAAAVKVAFVRNPWDRFVSEWLWRRHEWNAGTFAVCEKLVWGAKDLASLEAFARCLLHPRDERTSSVTGFDAHLEPQVDFLHNERGNLAVFPVCRYEFFEADCRALCARFGVSVPTKLPTLRASARDHDYRAYYTAETRAAVASFYAEDIEAFGYSF